MKKRFIALLTLALLLLSVAGLGEGNTVVFQGQVEVSADAEYVDLGDVKAKSMDDLIAFLEKLPNLKKVDMFETYLYARDVETLAQRFPDVEFGWTMLINCKNPNHPERKYHMIRTDATAFSTLHNNQCTMHTSEDFAILKYCKNLVALDIGHNAVTTLDFLAAMPKLRVLIIGRNQVKDLSPLKNCPDLEYLEAFTNQIESVEPLLSCPYLMDLNIPNNCVKDPELFCQMTFLKRLWIFNYASPRDFNKDTMPQKTKSAIKQALPGCRINTYSSGTGEWRMNTKHYQVISDMFTTGAYIPFEDSHQ
jgi:hypothetical protein